MKSEGQKRGRTNEAKILVVSHCILNRATRWRQRKKPKEEDQGPVSQVLEFLSARKIGAVQLPCPEFTFFGNPRPPATKDEYENLPEFQKHCERPAKASAQYLKTLVTMSRDQKMRILAVAGVERSPSCGVERTPRRANCKTMYVREKGLFMESIEREMKNLGLETPMIGLYLRNPEDFCRRLSSLPDYVDHSHTTNETQEDSMSVV